MGQPQGKGRHQDPSVSQGSLEEAPDALPPSLPLSCLIITCCKAIITSALFVFVVVWIFLMGPALFVSLNLSESWRLLLTQILQEEAIPSFHRPEQKAQNMLLNFRVVSALSVSGSMYTFLNR